MLKSDFGTAAWFFFVLSRMELLRTKKTNKKGEHLPFFSVRYFLYDRSPIMLSMVLRRYGIIA
jgi:hypothetical protein